MREISCPPAQILFQHLVVQTVQMFADDQVLLQLHLECVESGLEVRKAPVLSGERHGLHGLQLWPGVSRGEKNKYWRIFQPGGINT